MPAIKTPNGIINIPDAPTQQGLGNSYLNIGNANPQNYEEWQGLIRQLGFSNLENITDFNSPLYQQYQQYLQKTMGGIGVNSLLAPLMAGGAGYAGGQAIANQKAMGWERQRQDKINTGVQDFALGLQGQVLNQLGQLGDSFSTSRTQSMQQGEYDSAKSPLSQIGGVLGTGLGMFGNSLLGLLGGGGNRASASTVGGYGGGGI